MHYNNVHVSYILEYYHGYISHSLYFIFVNYSTFIFLSEPVNIQAVTII